MTSFLFCACNSFRRFFVAKSSLQDKEGFSNSSWMALNSGLFSSSSCSSAGIQLSPEIGRQEGCALERRGRHFDRQLRHRSKHNDGGGCSFSSVWPPYLMDTAHLCTLVRKPNLSNQCGWNIPIICKPSAPKSWFVRGTAYEEQTPRSLKRLLYTPAVSTSPVLL